MSEKKENEIQEKEKTVKLLDKTINSLTKLTDEIKINSLELNKITEKLNSKPPYNDNSKLVSELTNTLKNTQERMQIMEDLAIFFKEERGKMKAWNGVVSKSIAEVDETLQESVFLLKENIASQIKELTKFTISQREHFEKYIDEQNKLVNKKVVELSIITDELQNLSAVKEGIQELQRLTQEQNRKFDILAESIYKLMYEEAQRETLNSQKKNTPNWLQILVILIAVGILGLLSINILEYTGSNKSPKLDAFEQFENSSKF